MKIILFSLLCLILIGMTSYSYAQWTTQFNETMILPEVVFQSELRDSNGNLIAYIETEQIVGIDPFKLNYFLDNQTTTYKNSFTKDGTKYETQQWEVVEDKFSQKLGYSTTRLIDIYQHDITPLIIVLHDTFQTEPGDVLRIFWTITRSVS